MQAFIKAVRTRDKIY